MVLLPESELRTKHRDLCGLLNLEDDIVDASWEKFQKIYKNYALEGDVTQWLGFAIFEVCQSAETQTVDQAVMKGSCVSFTSLLRHSNLRPLLCSSAKIFEFTWNLFNTLKMEEPNYSSDLTKSYHIMYSCLDFAFRNAYQADRRDILKAEFVGVAEDCNKTGMQPTEPPCIIKHLCRCENSLTDAMHIKTYKFRELMMQLIDKDVLHGIDNFVGAFDPSVFEVNAKNISKAYEMQLSTKCCFDERIFLAEYKRKLLEQQQHIITKSVLSEHGDISALESPRVAPAGFQTPLTGRRFVGPKDQETDDSEMTHSKSLLHNMLNGVSAAPSDRLLLLFQNCSENPKDKIDGVVSEFRQIFLRSYEHRKLTQEEVTSRIDMGVRLFYKFIDSILHREKTFNRNDISAIVSMEIFYKCTLVGALEIVTFVFDNNKKLNRDFPWILDVFNVRPYDFVKVIELIVRTIDGLSRQIIKHLTRVEETILESLAWTSDSVLWQMIETAGEIPKFKETARPEQITSDSMVTTGSLPMQSPLGNNRQHSVTDVFQSPVNNNINRQLFPSVSPGQSLLQRHATHLVFTDPTSGENRLIPIVDSENEEQQNIISSPSDHENQNQVVEVVVPPTPRRTGSLAIFFRKFYNLAGERLDHLCTNLKKQDLKAKIWTIFEESVTKHTHLMRDRHLDQLLMCAVYVVAKVCQEHIMFTDVMRCYRTQPQATSDIYRNVLLAHKRREIVEGGVVEVPEVRGDLISFYNNTYVNEMKGLAQRLAPSNQKPNIMLSPLPVVKRQPMSSQMHVIGNVFVKPFENPNSFSEGSPSFSYIFNRSPSKDLMNINRAINGVINAKRLLSEDTEMDPELPQTKRTASYKKIQSLVEERKSQNLQ
ncbi:retinoblastoma-like protein 1 isoform X2 [Aethina tumida]|uniref:retinoblastoma-like protein 1 isoform X2 n=1 Tax=Aethina tumida TaxID=116153 RepID=UPI002148DD6D|nr:retinoblastoma-like protein 1 isoform X2 [Aethina tumida]